MADDKSIFEAGGGISSINGQRSSTFGSTVSKVAGATTPATTVNAKDPVLYMGVDSRIAFMPLSKATEAYYKWDTKTRNKFLSQLNLAGYDTSQLKDDQVAALWGGYVEAAAKYYAAGQAISPWDIMAKDRAQREAAGPKTVTQTSTSYDMSTQQDAHAIFLQAAQSLLGRDPTKSEITAFRTALNAYEKANPTVTKATTTTQGGEVTSQNSTTSGGVSADSKSLMAMEDIKRDPEYGAYQAATTYFDAMMAEIGG